MLNARSFVPAAMAGIALLAGCHGAVLPSAAQSEPASTAGLTIAGEARAWWRNDIGPRYQWEHNYGYCGEVSFISAGLYYGQYVSQYDARAAATVAPQNKYRSQLLLGGTDMRAARNMHLAMTEWNRKTERSSRDFLAWVKREVLLGYPVAIGIYTNEYRFYGEHDKHAGSPQYDHIVPVLGARANRGEPDYSPDDSLEFSDNGLLGRGPKHAPVHV